MMTGVINKNLISVRQGDSFTINLALNNRCQPMDLTGYVGLMQVRQKDNNEVVFSCFAEPVDMLQGKIAFVLTPVMTSIDEGDYVCDIQITSPVGEVHTIYPADVNKVATFRITRQVTV
jgi:hypothetical protein